MIERLRVRIAARAAGDFFFFSPELTLCDESYSVSVSFPVLTQWNVRDRGHSSQKCMWKYAYTLDPTKSGLFDYAAVQA